MSSPYEIARSQGYSDEEIMSYLSQNPKYSDKISQAREQGYSNEEIGSFISTYLTKKEEKKPKRTKNEKAARVGAQYTLGAAESALLPYEIAVSPLASKDAQNAAYREILGDDLERLLEQKAAGVWDETDQQQYDSIVNQLKDARESEKHVQTANIGVRALAEKLTGVDLHPEGILEKAASWAGFIKDPKKIAALGKDGLKLQEVIRAISPTGKEALRGIGAGTALEIAEDGGYGPIGTLAAAIVGDVAGSGTAGIAKGVTELITKPKQTLAKVAAKFTPKEKIELQKDVIKDFNKSGIQADIGTLTDSELLKMMQTKLAQSGLTGSALDDLKSQMTNQIKKEYESLASTLGDAKFATTHEAGQSVKNMMQRIREADLAEVRKLYTEAEGALKTTNAYVDPHRLANSIRNLENKLKPGSLKAGEQQAVLNSLKTLKRDLYDSSGKLMYANVKELMNNKIALNDIINFEVQGGAKQLLKTIVGEIDRAIVSHIKDNPKFAKKYIEANKRFSSHAKTFRNKNIDQLLRETADPEKIFNKMNSIEGIKSLKSVLDKAQAGKDTFNNLSRFKLDKVIGDNMVDSTSQQIKLGTFSKLLEKGKNRQVIKELLDPVSYRRLERLQKNAGKLAETAQKFLNASKSGVTVVDVGVVGVALKGIASILSGNPWLLAKTAGGILGARYLTKLMGDPKFLKLVEQAIEASSKNNNTLLMQLGQQLSTSINSAIKHQFLNSTMEPNSEKNSEPKKGHMLG
jgi:hypothetical protein